MDTEGRYTYASPRVQELLGYGPEEVLGWTPFELMLPEEAVRIGTVFTEILSAKRPFLLLENICLHKDGRHVVLETSGAPIFNLNGEFAGYRGIDRDITERKRAQEEFKASQQLLNNIVEHIPLMVFLKRAADLRFELFNKAGEAMMGMSRDQLIGRNDYDFFPKEQADLFTLMDRKVLERHEVVDIPEEPIETPHGKRTLHTRKITLRDQQGEPAFLLGVSEDITEALQNRAALQAERDLSDALIDTTQTIVLLLDTEGRIVRFNTYMEELCGYRLAEVKGRSWFDTFLLERDRERIRNLFSKAFDGTTRPDKVSVLVTRSGEERLVEWDDKPLKGPDGTVIGLLATGRDVTEQKRTEQALREREEVMSAIVAQAGDAIEMVDLETFRFSEFNDAAFSMLGYTREEYTRLTVFDIQGERSEQQIRAMEASIPTGGTRQFENRHRRKDGSLLDVLVKLRVIELHGRRYAVAIWRDITEDKRNIKELERYRQHLEQVLEERTTELKEANQQLLDTHFAMDQAGIGIHWVDAETGRIVYVGNHAAQMLGYSVPEMLELSIPDIDINFLPSEFKTITEPMFASGSTHFESQQRKKDGTLIPVDVIGYFRPAEDGKSSRFITFISDITERKKVEDELRAAKVAAEQANVAKSSFLANKGVSALQPGRQFHHPPLWRKRSGIGDLPQAHRVDAG